MAGSLMPGRLLKTDANGDRQLADPVFETQLAGTSRTSSKVVAPGRRLVAAWLCTAGYPP